jgi:hypothetical protein
LTSDFTPLRKGRARVRQPAVFRAPGFFVTLLAHSSGVGSLH